MFATYDRLQEPAFADIAMDILACLPLIDRLQEPSFADITMDSLACSSLIDRLQEPSFADIAMDSLSIELPAMSPSFRFSLPHCYQRCSAETTGGGEVTYPKDEMVEREEGGRIMQGEISFLIHLCAIQQDETSKSSSAANELGLANVGGVFVVLMGGMGVACVIAVCEFVWKSRKVAVEERIECLESVWIPLSLSMLQSDSGGLKQDGNTRSVYLTRSRTVSEIAKDLDITS
uniref:Uncharacterized protein n=1 Tax=Timema genevievae TaxID=629358 RepID=A0A7R9PJL3_TIMGE|nr:unnamed protein product [Timema genevievae]